MNHHLHYFSVSTVKDITFHFVFECLAMRVTRIDSVGKCSFFFCVWVLGFSFFVFIVSLKYAIPYLWIWDNKNNKIKRNSNKHHAMAIIIIIQQQQRRRRRK